MAGSCDFDFAMLKVVDDRSQCLISGYIHNVEKEESYLNIPELIAVIVIFYYYEFEKLTKCGDQILLNDDGDEAVRKDNSEYHASTMYGNIPIKINGMRYIWTLKIGKVPNRDSIFIGIDNSNKSCIDDDFCDPSEEFKIDYGYENFISYGWGTDKKSYNTDGGQVNVVKYGELIQENDLIKMELNTMDKSLRYFRNGMDQGIAFTNVKLENGTYYLAITMWEQQASLQLLDFECSSSNHS